MSSRDTVLASIRRSLGVSGSELPRRTGVEDRINAHRKGLIPQRGQLDGEALIALFCQKVEASAASVQRLPSRAEVPQAVAAYLREKNLPGTLRLGEDPRFAGMDFSATTLEVSRGASVGDDLNGLSYAFGGVAETGTLALASGKDNPTTLNFLPDYHFVVVDAADVRGDLESVFAKLREAYGEGEMPRLFNLITGPSRSGDIEQKLLFGAHGPRSLHVMVVG